VEAEIAELNARRALYAAKERAIYTPLPGRVVPRIESSQPAMYVNDQRIDARVDHQPVREEISNEPLPASDDDDVHEPASSQLAAPYRSNRAGFVVNESADAYDLRMHRLAREIYDLCRDVNPPTQDAIKERVPMTRGGLLRSHDDITRALNILATRRLIEPARGQGITRHWLDGQGRPLPKTPRQKGITSNVPVTRG